MPNPLKNKHVKGFLPYLLFAAAVIASYMIIKEFRFFIGVMTRIWSVITPFFYGFLLAYILNIPYSSIKRLLGKIKWKFFKKIYKPLSLFITYILLAAAVFFVLYLIIPYIYRSVSTFVNNLPAYYESTLAIIHTINDFGFFDIGAVGEGILTEFSQAGFSIDSISTSINALLAVPSVIFTVFLTFISSVYILVEKDKFKAFICRLLRVFIPDGAGAAVIKYTDKLNHNFKRYIRVQTIDGIILGTIATVELYILRSPYALILGIILGVLNYIPYFGSIIGSIIAVTVVALTQGFTQAAIAAGVLLVTQQIDGNIIQPKLMGKSFSFSPLLVIISVTAGGAFAGVIGMIAAIPIVALLKDILETVTSHYEQKKEKNCE
jgi:predicted PurR-regulated permease PerM